MNTTNNQTAQNKKKSTKSREQLNDQRSNLWAIKIHIPYENPGFYLDFDTLMLVFTHFAFILHDCDIVEVPNNENKSGAVAKIAPPHYHIVARSYSRTYFNPIKKKLMQLFNLPDNVITVDKIYSLTGALRYLLHLDNPEKHSYSMQNIYCNNTTWLYENLQISEQSQTEYIISVLKECDGDYEYLIRVLGLNNCKRYHSIIYMWFKRYYKADIS